MLNLCGFVKFIQFQVLKFGTEKAKSEHQLATFREKNDKMFICIFCDCEEDMNEI